MPSFDLVHEPWVAVVEAGRTVELPLLDVLTRAHQIDGLALDDPLEAVALLRQVLLPVVLHALGPPRSSQEWEQRWQAGRLDADRITDYLQTRGDRFDLFHPERPFAQVAGLRTENNKTKPVSLLVPHAATGNNVPLFASRTEAEPPALTPAAAARAVLAAHCWDTAAIKSGVVGDPQVKAGKTTGNPTGPAGQLGVIIPLGSSLAETLFLNLPILPQGLERGDRPQWQVDEPWGPPWRPKGTVLGLLDLLTWQARRIRLIPGADGLVREVVLAAGDRLVDTPLDIEPHTAWRRSEKPVAGRATTRPLRHQPGRSAWRGLTSLLATRTENAGRETGSLLMTQLGGLYATGAVPVDLRLQVLTVGVVYGNQSAVVDDLLVDLTPLPVAALPADSTLRELLLQVVREAEALRRAANDLGDDLRQAVGADKLPWDKGLRLGDGLIHSFTDPIRRLLGGLQREPDRGDEAEQAWRATARRLALDTLERAVDGAPPSAFLGRHEHKRQDGKTYRHQLASAEAMFRHKLNEILGPRALTTTGDRS